MDTGNIAFAGAGNALLDLAVRVQDGFAEDEGFLPGAVSHVDPERGAALAERISRLAHAGAVDIRTSAGGGAAVAARVMSALGYGARFCGAVGMDRRADLFRAGLDAAGVQAVLHQSAIPTGVFVLLAEPSGCRTLVVAPGAAFDMPESMNIARMAPRGSGTRAILHMDALLESRSPGRLRRMAADARSAGMLVSIDLSTPGIARSRADTIGAAFGYCDTVFGTDAEWRALGGADRAALANPGTIILRKRGHDGVDALRGATHEHAPAPGVNVVDETGAGDAFAAAFLAGLASGDSVERCLGAGSIAAGVLLRTFGTRFDPELLRTSMHGHIGS